MAIQYKGVTADCPVIKAIEAEIDRIDEVSQLLISANRDEDLEIILVRRDTLLKVYKQFTEPYETYVLEGSN